MNKTVPITFCTVIKKNELRNWAYIKGWIQKWIDRLIVSQGSKYWSWFKKNVALFRDLVDIAQKSNIH